MPPDPAFLRGAFPSPRHKLLSTPPHRVIRMPPAELAYVPPRLDVWSNSTYGDCVTAEEAFALACHSPSIFLDAAVVVAWARKHGVLNGATLTQVMDYMQRDGFKVGNQVYDDGPYYGVDYSDETVLHSAIAEGPVKIAIDANALPSTAGKAQGWYATGGGRFPSTDHCTSICGFGPAGWLYQQLGVPLPPELQDLQPGYLLFTWGSLGFVDHAWIMSTCVEAWVRNPTTIGVPPLPEPQPPGPPGPPEPPGPPPPPTPTPTPLYTRTFTRAMSKGSPVLYLSPVAVPKGSRLICYPPTQSAEESDEGPLFEEE